MMKASGVLIVVLFMILAFMAGNAHAEKIVVVKKGDTLWQISRAEFSTGTKCVDIAERNNIKDPRKLQIGQKIIIPEIANIEITNPPRTSYGYGAKAEKGNLKVLAFIENTQLEKNAKEELAKVVSLLNPEQYILLGGAEVSYTSDARGVYGNNITVFAYNWKKIDYLKSQKWSAVVGAVAYELIVIDSGGNAILRWQEIEDETAIAESDDVMIAEGETAEELEE